MNTWEQQPDESAAQYKAFTAYLSERNIEAAYRKYIREKKPEKAGKSRKKNNEPSGSFKQWARLFRWEERAREYDDHLHEEVIRATVSARKKQYEERTKLYGQIANKTHSVILKKMTDPEAVSIKLSELVEAARYYDAEHLAEMERVNLLELEKAMKNKA